mmetsp:Transcript_25110/g.45253  ORF Transcript_25110/g.45253 Transcript_25110/m.45253 type:complete len:86 (+) Transcript_25110:95-352(+)
MGTTSTTCAGRNYQKKNPSTNWWFTFLSLMPAWPSAFLSQSSQATMMLSYLKYPKRLRDSSENWKKHDHKTTHHHTELSKMLGHK